MDNQAKGDGMTPHESFAGKDFATICPICGKEEVTNPDGVGYDIYPCSECEREMDVADYAALDATNIQDEPVTSGVDQSPDTEQATE